MQRNIPEELSLLCIFFCVFHNYDLLRGLFDDSFPINDDETNTEFILHLAAF